jgi:hypothetical protein
LASQLTGVIRLPRGVVEISSELTIAPGAHDLTILGSDTILKASDHFNGRAILSGLQIKHVRLSGLTVDGNRGKLSAPLEMAPPENYFRLYYPNNGVLFDQAEDVAISDVHFTNIVNFAVLISRSSTVHIVRVLVEDSGSLNKLGRNNTTGGVILEDGSSDFEVRESTFIRIRGNALWTHSLRISPRLRDGLFTMNKFDTIGRDALQVGHATNVQVDNNSGVNIGMPPEIVDVETGGTPVAMDTAGNVDHSVYSRNRFKEIDGKCIDLDGFHDGSVHGNECINRRRAQDYPFGHFGIVMNNTDPGTNSENIEISENHMDGTKFGGLFIIGSGHRIVGNVFEHLNTAQCNESAKTFGCIFKIDEPEMLEAGIYLGQSANRPAETHGNVIRGNRISGHMMKTRCIILAPRISRAQNSIEDNDCADR